MWPARAFDLPHHFEVLFSFLFLCLLLNNPPSSYSPGVHMHPYQHVFPVQCSACRCASGVCVSSPVGCSTPASTRPIKYTSGELLALQAPVHLAARTDCNPQIAGHLMTAASSPVVPRWCTEDSCNFCGGAQQRSQPTL